MSTARRLHHKKTKAGQSALHRARSVVRSRLSVILSLNLLRLCFRIGFALGFAVLAAGLWQSGAVSVGAAMLAVLSLMAASVTQRLIESRVAQAETAVVKRLLSDVEHACSSQPALEILQLPRGSVVSGITRQPAAVARLCVRSKAARQMLLVGPFLVAATIWYLSWQPAVILLLSLPVMVLLFVVFGRLTAQRARRQEASIGRLATQFADRMRALPTIVASDVLDQEAAKLSRCLKDHGERTADVLSVAFLNSAVLDLVAGVSLAAVAGLLCVAHFGTLPFGMVLELEAWASLFILMLVPEFFGPFRQHAENYHAKAEGRAAAEALDWAYAVTKSPKAAPELHGTDALTLSQGQPIGTIEFPEAGLVVITGPSGAGKTTLLRVLAGVEAPLSGQAGLAKAPRVSWAASDTPLEGETLASALVDGQSSQKQAALLRLAAQLNLVGDPRLPAGLETALPKGDCPLSGGQRMRAVLARALMSGHTIIADEPTAKLDPTNARAARHALRAAGRNRLVIAATHDPDLIAAADLEVAIGDEAAAPEGRIYA